MHHHSLSACFLFLLAKLASRLAVVWGIRLSNRLPSQKECDGPYETKRDSSECEVDVKKPRKGPFWGSQTDQLFGPTK
ncbi:hypothetical protein Ddc_07105 [Ditylenchus destructor]|nr:hypothetical protein Ddc_07105 [Ditylenchus destructor]